MASVTGLQTQDKRNEKTTELTGTATMDTGDDVLIIEIPVEDQAPTNRTVEVRWQIVLKEVEDTP